MIVQTVTETMFIEAFREMDRMENFSIDSLKVLYEFLEDMSEDTGENFELDVIALCCDFNEMTYKEIIDEYDLATFDELAELDDDEQMELIVDRLSEETMVVYHDNEKVLFQVF